MYLTVYRQLATMVILLAWLCGVQCRPRSNNNSKEYSVHNQSQKRIKQARITAIQDEILVKLGLRDVPSARNASDDEIRNVLRTYRKSLEHSNEKIHDLFPEEEFYAKQYNSIVYKDEIKIQTSADVTSYHMKFNIELNHPVDPKKETYVPSASLDVFAIPADPDNIPEDLEDVTVNLYQLLSDPSSLHRQRRWISSLRTSLTGPRRLQFDLTTALQSWIDSPELNYGIELSCDYLDITKLLKLTSISNIPTHNDQDLDALPSLNFYTQERHILGRQKRSKRVRDAADCIRGDGETRCCRYPLWVDFHDIGWDWVVEPRGFQAFYCDGSCPYRYRSAHIFAGIQSAVNLLNPAAAPSPSCTATQLAPLEILHYNERGHLEVSEFSDMIVQNCGCA